jgi:hypothetical protein
MFYRPVLAAGNGNNKRLFAIQFVLLENFFCRPIVEPLKSAFFRLLQQIYLSFYPVLHADPHRIFYFTGFFALYSSLSTFYKNSSAVNDGAVSNSSIAIDEETFKSTNSISDATCLMR